MSNIIDQVDGRIIKTGGTAFRYFSGTSYLGLSYDAEYKEKILEGFDKFGSSFGGSRRSNCQFEEYDKFEIWLAEWLETEKATTVSSGTLAGQLIKNVIFERDIIAYTPHVHPAIDYGIGIHTSKNNPNWIQSLNATLEPMKASHVLIVGSSVDPIGLEILDPITFSSLPGQHDYLFVLDDSHGVGILGPEGKGISSKIPIHLKNKVLLLGSLGKALGIPGGFIAGSSELINQITDSPAFGGASPIIPAYLYAFDQIKNTLYDNIKRLKTNINLLECTMQDIPKWKTHPELSVATSMVGHAGDWFQKKGCIISSFAYPSKNDPVISRIVVNALHTPDDIEFIGRLSKNLEQSVKNDAT